MGDGTPFVDVAHEAVAIVAADLHKFDYSNYDRRFDPNPDPRLDGLAIRLADDWKDRESLRGLPDDTQLKLFVRVLPPGGARFGAAGLGELLVAAAVVNVGSHRRAPCERHRKRMAAALVMSRKVGLGHGWLVAAVDGLSGLCPKEDRGAETSFSYEYENLKDNRECSWSIGVGETTRGRFEFTHNYPAGLARRPLHVGWEPKGSAAGLLAYEETGGPWAHVRDAGLGGEGTDSTKGRYEELECFRNQVLSDKAYDPDDVVKALPWVLWDIPFPNCVACADWPPGFRVNRCGDPVCASRKDEPVVLVLCVAFSPTLRAWGDRMRAMGPAGVVRLGYPLQAMTNDRSRFPFCGERILFTDETEDFDQDDERNYPLRKPCGGLFDCAGGLVSPCNWYIEGVVIQENSDDRYCGHGHFTEGIERHPVYFSMFD